LLLSPARRWAVILGKMLGASDQFGLDITVLALSALAAIGLGVLSMRRGIAQ